MNITELDIEQTAESYFGSELELTPYIMEQVKCFIEEDEMTLDDAVEYAWDLYHEQ